MAEEEVRREREFRARIPIKRCEIHNILLFWCVHCNRAVCRYCEPNHQLEHYLPRIK
ncbi:MAG: hypothetical protein RQ952_02160 [Thermoproteota archaeon]|nr:hypothetical protein [Thermoproteota archaeon]